MISSKLILFFCFYLLLLLDNSLGQKALVTQVGNKELFKAALDFGATFGGLLGLLGSQWKQLLIQLVHAKRNVGLGKYQLARFNNSATTEEVGLAITDNYADKVAELVAIRTQDIGSTQKYIDDLEILKNEIALTMIVEMDETKEQFKKENVRRKIKEAKENGITDTDIKELLFAEFIESGEGLSLIDGRASIADRLLSSFLNGMESILKGKLGILEYGNGLSCVSSRNCGAGGGDNDRDNNDRGGTNGAPLPGGGRAPDSGAGGGGDPPDNRPPYDRPPDDDPPNEDEEDDDPEEEDVADREGAGGSVLLGRATDYTPEERLEVNNIVIELMNQFVPEIERAERIVRDLQRQEVNGYDNPSLQAPEDHYLSYTERLDLNTRRDDYLRNILEHTIYDLIERSNAFFNWFYPRYLLVIANMGYYADVFYWNRNDLTTPEELGGFEDLSHDSDRMRYLLSTRLWLEMERMADRFDDNARALIKIRDELQKKIKSKEIKVNNPYIYHPAEAPTFSDGAVGDLSIEIADRFTPEETEEVNRILNRETDELRREIRILRRSGENLERLSASGFVNDSSLRIPEVHNPNNEESLALYRRRIHHFRIFLERSVESLIRSVNTGVDRFYPTIELVRANYEYYTNYNFGGGSGLSLPEPKPLAAFEQLTENSPRMRFLLLYFFQNRLYEFSIEYDAISQALRTMRSQVLSLIEADEIEIHNLLQSRPNSTLTLSEEGAVGGQEKGFDEVVQDAIEQEQSLHIMDRLTGFVPRGAFESDHTGEGEEIDVIVAEQLNPMRSSIEAAEEIVRNLIRQDAFEYATDQSLQVPKDNDSNETDRLALYTRRVNHFRNILENTVNDLIDQLDGYFEWFYPRLRLAIENRDYYMPAFFRNRNRPGYYRTPPEELVAFKELSYHSDRMRYLLSYRLSYEMNRLADSIQSMSEFLRRTQDKLRKKLKSYEMKIKILTPPNSTPTPPEG